ncbi:MAG: hypothetical protein JNJ57_16725, partial [Saprospiraceae bacterium]|nr:hypothetical protein [Saprospiraceae bacterium]
MNKQLKSFVSAVWLYFFIISSVVAQWQEIPKPNGTPVYSLEYDGSRWFAGGGGLHARSFDAKAWQKITSIPGSGYFRMKKVGQRMYSSEQYEFWSDWLVNTIRFSEDGGDNWLDVSLPATITRAFFSGSRIFVQQENNNAAMFMSTNDGQTWQSVLTIPLGIGGSGSVYDLIGWNGELRCVSHEGVYASTNQGSSWNRIADCPEPPQAGDSVNVEGSARLFLFNQRLFLTGPFSNVHYSDNGGLQWHLIPSLQGVRDMVAHNGALFATGPNAGLKRSDDNGLTWTTVAAPDDAGYALESDGSQLLLSGGSGIFRSPDAGVSWFSSHGLLQEGNGSPVWQMVQFDGKYILKQNKNIFETADQGQTWKFLFQAGQISRICVDGDACFIYPYFKTLGGSFQSVPLPVPISIDQYFTAAGDGKLFAYYLQTGEVWRSLNDGASWQNMGVSTSNYPYGISYYNGSLFVASYPDVLRSQNDGQTWQTAHQGLGNLDNSKYLYNAGNQLYLSLSSTVYRFDGTAWVLFYNNLSHIGAWNNRVFGYRSGLVVSADNGQTWNNIGGSNPGLDFNSLSIVDNKLCCSGFRLGGFDTQVIWTLDLNGFNAGVWSGRLFLDTN